MRPNHTFHAFAILLLTLCLTSLARADQDLVIPAGLRPGVSADLAVTVREPPGRPRCAAGPIAVAVHGLAHTAATFTPLADELLRRGATPRCGIALLDLPGHGRSGLPSGIAFGQLLLDDYVTALLAALEGLRARGLQPRVLLGHSLGGLIIELAQARLLSQGTSLRRVTVQGGSATRMIPFGLSGGPGRRRRPGGVVRLRPCGPPLTTSGVPP